MAQLRNNYKKNWLEIIEIQRMKWKRFLPGLANCSEVRKLLSLLSQYIKGFNCPLSRSNLSTVSNCFYNCECKYCKKKIRMQISLMVNNHLSIIFQKRDRLRVWSKLPTKNSAITDCNCLIIPIKWRHNPMFCCQQVWQKNIFGKSVELFPFLGIILINCQEDL